MRSLGNASPLALEDPRYAKALLRQSGGSVLAPHGAWAEGMGRANPFGRPDGGPGTKRRGPRWIAALDGRAPHARCKRYVAKARRAAAIVELDCGSTSRAGSLRGELPLCPSSGVA